MQFWALNLITFQATFSRTLFFFQTLRSFLPTPFGEGLQSEYEATLSSHVGDIGQAVMAHPLATGKKRK